VYNRDMRSIKRLNGANDDYVVGLEAAYAISAVEGISYTNDMKRKLEHLVGAQVSDEERRELLFVSTEAAL
jgi:hypothetical protein